MSFAFLIPMVIIVVAVVLLAAELAVRRPLEYSHHYGYSYPQQVTTRVIDEYGYVAPPPYTYGRY